MPVERSFILCPDTVRSLVNKAGLTQEKLAIKARVSVNTAKKAFTKKPMLMSSCVQIAKALEVTPDALILTTETETAQMLCVSSNDNHSQVVLPSSMVSIDEALSYFTNNQFPEALASLEALAEQANDVVAMNHLAWMYQHGLGVAIDQPLAARWYYRAAELGSVNGQTNYGWMLQYGLGVELDYEKARYWYELAATGGDGLALNQLGWMYQKGVGVSRDYGKALQLYQESAATGNTQGLNNLAWMHHFGLGTPKNRELAITYYRRAIENGNKDSIQNLNLLLQSK